jgi:hypothetical protein
MFEGKELAILSLVESSDFIVNLMDLPGISLLVDTERAIAFS